MRVEEQTDRVKQEEAQLTQTTAEDRDHFVQESERPILQHSRPVLDCALDVPLDLVEELLVVRQRREGLGVGHVLVEPGHDAGDLMLVETELADYRCDLPRNDALRQDAKYADQAECSEDSHNPEKLVPTCILAFPLLPQLLPIPQDVL